MVTLSELQHVTQGRWLTKPNENLHIRYIFSDSRKTYGVAHGAFFAMRGTKHNAHAHVDEVYANHRQSKFFYMIRCQLLQSKQRVGH